MGNNLVKATLVLVLSALSAACTYIERATVSSTGVEANNGSIFASVSEDGRYVVYASGASNLVFNDTNSLIDIFRRDILGGTTERASLKNNGTEIFLAPSSGSKLSANGNVVIFSNELSGIVFDDTNSNFDVFARDMTAGFTTRVSVDSFGNQADGNSVGGAISDNGRVVAFWSDAIDLVPGDTNGVADVFVRDMDAGTTTRVSVDSAGNQSNTERPLVIDPGNLDISGDGRYVVFSSLASNLVPGDTNGEADVFLHDRVDGTTVRVSVDSLGNQSNGPSTHPSISTSGGSIVFVSAANNLVTGDSNAEADIFLHRIIQTGLPGLPTITSTSRVSVSGNGAQANAESSQPSVSGDGRYVGFTSAASNLVPADSNAVEDVFVRDTVQNNTRRVSEDSEGNQANFGGSGGDLSKNGRYIAFSSLATNLDDGDTNGARDIFLRAVQEIEITSVVPALIPVGGTSAVTVTGKDFLPGTTISVADATVTNLVIVDENTITMTVTARDGVDPGARNASALLPGTGAGLFTGTTFQCNACFTFF